MATSPESASRAAGPLDVRNLVSQLIAEESKAHLAPLTRKAEQLRALISAYGALRAVLEVCQQALAGLGNTDFNAHQPGALADAVRGFVQAVDTMRMATAELARKTPPEAGDKAQEVGTLPSDTLMQHLLGQWHNGMPVTGTHQNRSLLALGIRLHKDYRLTVDADALHKAVNDNPAGLAVALFCPQRGLLARTQTLLQRLLHDNGPLAGRIRAWENSLKAVCDQQAMAQQRLASLRESYLRQFNRLNITLEKMQASQDPGLDPLSRLRKP